MLIISSESELSALNIGYHIGSKSSAIDFIIRVIDNSNVSEEDKIKISKFLESQRKEEKYQVTRIVKLTGIVREQEETIEDLTEEIAYLTEELTSKQELNEAISKGLKKHINLTQKMLNERAQANLNRSKK